MSKKPARNRTIARRSRRVKAGSSGHGPRVFEEETRAVYRDLAAREFDRDCRALTACCRFKLTGKVPQLTRGEAVVAAKALRAHGRKTLPDPLEPGACPMLKADGRCRIYEGRPFGCRTHFCAAAGGVIERRAIVDLVRRLERIDEAMGGRGPLPLAVAIGEAMGKEF